MIGSISRIGMYGGVSGVNPYLNRYPYNPSVQQTGKAATGSIQPAGQTSVVMAPGRRTNLDVPVEPVQPAPAVGSNAAGSVRYSIPFLREGMDPAELAVRMRIRYSDGVLQGEEGAGAEQVQKALEEGECKTCEERKYQDGSDDPGVSFKTAAHISPEQAAATVRGHEMEHVVREQSKAEREDRKVVSQSVSIHTAICPECGKAYVSGGTTRTVTAESQDIAESNEIY